MLATVKIIKFTLGHRIIHINSGEKKRSTLLHLVKTMDTSGSLLTHSETTSGNLVPLVSLTSFQQSLDDGQHNLKLGIVSGARIRESSILKEKVLGLLSLVDKEGHIPSVINNKIGTVTLAIILRPGQSIQGALPVFLKRLTLPCENSGRLVTCNSCSSMILSGKDITTAPAHITTECVECFNENSSLDGHMKGSGDTCTLEAFSVLLAAGH
mmetsp:Transcript_52673/g.78076  ORF Transcript_52673/g.78076 Transcript_52673/m.78076 type:complete len:212 (+) Transcript_52673:775-1410(+)